MRNLDLKFSERRTFVFSDVRLTQRSSFVNHTRRVDPKTFVPFRKIAEDSGGSTVLRYATQLSYIFSLLLLHFCHHPSSVFCWVVPEPSSAEMSTYRRIYIPSRTDKADIMEDANSHKVILCNYPFQEVYARLSIGLPRRTPASEVPLSRRTSTSWCWWLRRWSGFLVLISHAHDCRCQKLPWSPLEHCPFSLHW